MIDYRSIYQRLAKELNLNIRAVPQIEKVVISSGIGSSRDNKAKIENLQEDLKKITGQKPVPCLSRQAIAGFKLRKGEIIGFKVTLRRRKMWDFLEKLANLTLPTIRDFRGLNPQGFDKSHNFSLGIKEHMVFPEVSFDTPTGICGLQITIQIKARSRQEAQKLIEYIGFPFAKESK